eukprot:2401338-Rhodomonas_salina.2
MHDAIASRRHANTAEFCMAPSKDFKSQREHLTGITGGLNVWSGINSTVRSHPFLILVKITATQQQFNICAKGALARDLRFGAEMPGHWAGLRMPAQMPIRKAAQDESDVFWRTLLLSRGLWVLPAPSASLAAGVLLLLPTVSFARPLDLQLIL